jgi:hypothetical protein
MTSSHFYRLGLGKAVVRTLQFVARTLSLPRPVLIEFLPAGSRERGR